jgi:hypothetical protein
VEGWQIVNMWTVRGVILLAVGALSFGFGYDLARDSWRAKFAEAERDAAQSQMQAVADAVDAHRLRVTELERVNDETKQTLADLHLAAYHADAESERLQLALNDYVRRASARHCPSGTATERAAAATEQLVLAELFRRADKRAGELAAIADDSRARGLACEASYKAVQ